MLFRSKAARHWLCDQWRAALWISFTDYQAAQLATLHRDSFGGEGAARFFQSHGLHDPASLDQVRARSTYYSGMVPKVPSQFHRLQDQQKLLINGQTWQCISGYGHAPEHMALYQPSRVCSSVATWCCRAFPPM